MRGATYKENCFLQSYTIQEASCIVSSQDNLEVTENACTACGTRRVKIRLIGPLEGSLQGHKAYISSLDVNFRNAG